jgi:hypothetical protein
MPIEHSPGGHYFRKREELRALSRFSRCGANESERTDSAKEELMRTILMSLAILGLLAAGEARAEDKPRSDKHGKKEKKMKQEPGLGKHLKGLPGRTGPGVEGKTPPGHRRMGQDRMGQGRMGPGGRGMRRGMRDGGGNAKGMKRAGMGSRFQRGGGMQGKGKMARRMIMKRLLQAKRAGKGQGRMNQAPRRPLARGLERLKAMKGGNQGAVERGKRPSREMGRGEQAGKGRWLEALKKLHDARGKAGKGRNAPRPPEGKKGRPGPTESEF